MKRTFILGAGFSKDIANFPTLAQLSEQITEKYSELPAHIQAYLKSDVPTNLHTNIESLLTYLVSDLPWADLSDTYTRRAVFYELSGILNNILTEHEHNSPDPKLYVNDLIEFWHLYNSEVISFNYDVLIELYSKNLRRILVNDISLFDGGGTGSIGRTSKETEHLFYHDLEKNKLHVSLAIGSSTRATPEHLADWRNYYKASDGTRTHLHEAEGIIERLSKKNGIFSKLNQEVHCDSLYKTNLVHINSRDGVGVLGGDYINSFSLYKLHGSTNWYYSGLQETRNEPIYLDTSLGKSFAEEKESLTPVIIPPVLDKKDFYKNLALSMQWKKALEALHASDTKEIYFVGYSLPITDLLARNLFSKALIGQQKKIYIVNKLDGSQSDLILLKNYLSVLTSLDNQKLDTASKELLKSRELKIEENIFSIVLSTNNEESAVEKMVRHLKEEHKS